MKYGRKLIVAVLTTALFYTADAQVNLTTGAAEYSIPLYSYTDGNNRLATGIALEYISGNGLKVNEIPSAVGAGWNLECGGYIERIQHGEPDDQKRYMEIPYTDMNTFMAYPNPNYVNLYYPNGYYYSEYNPATLIANGGGYSALMAHSKAKFGPKPEYKADYEQDVFIFNFNGRAGFFVISKPDQNGNYEIRTLVDSKLKIQKIDGDLNNTNNIRTTISEFQITDENGIRYVFKDAEVNQVCAYDTGQFYNPDGTVYIDEPGWDYYYHGNSTPPPTPLLSVVRATTRNAFIKNKWYLSEIINPLSGQKIVFEYDSYAIDMQGALTAQVDILNGRTEFGLTQERLIGTRKRLKKILFSAAETAEFNYSALPRQDVPVEKALSNIDIRYNGITKLKWVFETGYFVKNIIRPETHNFTAEDKAWSRLCLQKLFRTGANGATEPPYVFEYYLEKGNAALTDVVPPLFSFQSDLWGYYNPFYTGFYNPATGTYGNSWAPYTAFGGNMMPKSYYYMLTVPFSTHNFQYRKPTFESRNGVLKFVKNPMGGTLNYEYELNYFIAVGQSFHGAGGVRVNKTSENDGLNATAVNIREYKYVKEGGTATSAWGGTDGQAYTQLTNMRIYKKCGDQRYPGVNVVEIATIFDKVYFASSVGMAFFSTVCYAASKLMPNAMVSIISAVLGPDYQDYTLETRNSTAFNAHNLIPMQYARVEVIDRLGAGTIGKTVHEFTSPAETSPAFAIDFPTLDTPFSSKQRYAYWLYGLPKKITVYDKDYNIITKTENDYTPFKDELENARFLSQKWAPIKRTYGCSMLPGTSPHTDEISHDTYYPITGRIELATTKNYVYNSNNEQTLTTTSYEYSPLNYSVKKTTTTNSKGEAVENLVYYAAEYNLPGAIQTMKDNNMVGVQAASQTLITKGTDKYVLQGNVSEYGTAPNGDIKTVKSYVTRSVDPIPLAQASFNPTQLLPNTANYKETGSFLYNTDGNSVQASSESGTTAMLFDYNKKINVATVTNALADDIAYTSFEADGKGGWTFDASRVADEWGPTGRKTLKAQLLDGGTTVTRTLNPAKTYTLAFWVKGTIPYMSGASFILKTQYANVATGYTWYEFEISNCTTLTITNRLGGRFGSYVSFNLDELRLYPVNARMQTATYDPMVGKTADCDENGRVTYYEYDEMRRLRLIRDANRNVTKTYEYNFKQ
jgi:hypothetical protein